MLAQKEKEKKQKRIYLISLLTLTNKITTMKTIQPQQD
jgi:hypothetical protein